MLPLYKAKIFNGIIEKGGRTKPWSVLVDTGSGAKQFVVKMFPAQMVHDKDSVTSEVLGHILSKEFDLPMPEAALIEMDMNFQMTINDGQAQMAFDQADDRVKFGTEVIDGNYLFNPAFTRAQASRMIDIDTLYGFDNLIRNPDRGNARPNLLVKSKSAYLIDHELAFMLDARTKADFIKHEWDDKFSRHHICWNYLKNARKPVKNEYFNSFEEYLRRLNVNGLGPYFQQLRHEGFNPGRHELIRDWLTYAKENSRNFVTLLKETIA
jgi:hypothetical protein